MRTCTNHHCRRAMPVDASHCPYCGKAQAGSWNRAYSLAAIAVLAILVILGARPLLQRLTAGSAGAQLPKTILVINTSTPVPPTQKIASPTHVLATRTPFKLQQIAAEEISPTSTYMVQSCAGAPPPRIQIDDLVEVVTTDRDRLVLRSSPEIHGGTEIRRLVTGTRLKIFDGPVCVQDPETYINYWFWEVRIKATKELGWIAEGDRGLYFVEIVR